MGFQEKNKDVMEFIAINALPAVILNQKAESFEEAYDLSVDFIQSGKAIEKLKEVCR